MREQNLTEAKLITKFESNYFDSAFCLLNDQFLITDSYYSLLSQIEINHAATLKFEKRKSTYLLGRIAAKKAVLKLFPKVQASDFSITSGIFKFPIVKGIANIQVCITHCEEFTIAIAYQEEHPMGIDIEKINPYKLDLIKSQLTESELVHYEDLNISSLTGCTMLWTIKEALSKVLKTGLTINFKLLEIETLKQSEQQYISTFTNFHQYKAVSYCTNDYVCSIVLPIHTEVNLTEIWNGLNESPQSLT